MARTHTYIMRNRLEMLYSAQNKLARPGSYVQALESFENLFENMCRTLSTVLLNPKVQL